MNRPIVLRFSNRKGLFTRLIQFVTWGLYSHVDIETAGGKLLGARVIGGVKERDESDEDTNYQRYEITLTEEQEHLFWAYAYSQLGKPYDMIAVLCYPLRISHHSKKGWDCSEFAGECFEQAGVPLQMIDETYKLSPRDLRMSPLLTLCSVNK